MPHRKNDDAPEPPEPTTFADLGLSDRALAAIKHIGFDDPSPIQKDFIPVALTGKDCIGRARTGTGKTAAFLLPIFEHFFAHEKLHALILAPTRELAGQIARESGDLSGKLPPRVTTVVGGQPIKRQMDHLRSNPEIVVATPGRVIDLGKRGVVAFNRFHIVVLDEVDRMFDMGFRKDIRYILDRCTHRRQTMFLSATLPDDIMKLAEKYLDDPVRVSTVDEESPSVESIEQRYFSVSQQRKLPLLLSLIKRDDPGLALVFTRTKAAADRVGAALKKDGISAEEIHGDLSQRDRDRVMKQFRDGKLQVVVATDLMGRGIDVPGVTHVVNYDIPENPEDYLHRIGRSGRMNAIGTAYTFVTAREGEELTAIEMLCNCLLEKDEVDDFESGVAPPKAGTSRLDLQKKRTGGRGGKGGGGRSGGGGRGGRGGGRSKDGRGGSKGRGGGKGGGKKRSGKSGGRGRGKSRGGGKKAR